MEILVVDDNSPDGTGATGRPARRGEPRVHVLHRPGKSGLGKAYIAGFRWALERGYDLVFEMDADFRHDPRFLPSFLERNQQADLVLGSRYKAGVNVINWPISRLLLSLGANQYARLVTGLPLTDSTGGFKCFRRAGTGGDRLGAGPVQRLLLPDRDELPGLEEGVPAAGDSDRLHRSGRGAEQDERTDRPGGDLDGLVAAAQIAGGTAMKGTAFLQDDRVGERFRHARRPGQPPRRWTGSVVAALCDRRNGVGADGLVVLTPAGGSAVRMTFWNSDGSRAAMCGNAALCSARLAVSLGLVPAGSLCLLTDAGMVEARADGQGDAAEIRCPISMLPAEVPGLGPGNGEAWLVAGTVGVPHLVVRVATSRP